MQDFVQVAKVDELVSGEMKLIELGVNRILLVNYGGTFYALTESCPHAGVEMSDGDLEGDEVICPAHGSRFNVITGEVTASPADEPLGTYTVRVEGNDVLVRVGDH